MLYPDKLRTNDLVGFVSPCYMAERNDIMPIIKALEDMGLRCKVADNVFSVTDVYAATLKERADDFNQMVHDDSVKAVFFTGGEVGNEIIPYIDYDYIRAHPKIFMSYSDGTTILNAITCKSGISTFYGAIYDSVTSENEKNKADFIRRLMSDSLAYENASQWKTIRGGKAQGILIGGYLINYAVMTGGKYFGLDKNEQYLLFLEDHESFTNPAAYSKWLSHITQSGITGNISGLICGHYSENEYNEIYDIIRRFAEEHGIPAVKNDDFGHGSNHMIIPIGARAVLDADTKRLILEENGLRKS